jgi:hypothetical protein
VNVPRRRGIVPAVILVLLAAAALRDLTRLGPGLPWRNMDDFPDFYCAGWSLDRNASPYTYEPLRTCEHRVNAGAGYRGQLFTQNHNVAIPAPLPPYDFPPFMSLARLPFANARLVDAIAIVVAVAACAVVLALLDVPIEVSVAALALSGAYVELNTGQVVPFALLALVLCGLALARRREILAGIFAALTAIEPTLGLPVIVATFLYAPRARWPIVATSALLALLALKLAGTPTLLEYATRVVPAQASSETSFPFQYSLSYAAAYAGLAPSAAAVAGVASYFVLLAIGLLAGPRLSAITHRRELLVFVPALCSVTGGSYLHQEELCFAIPALLVLAIGFDGIRQTIFAFALCVLSVPWILVWGSKQLFLASICVCFVILLRLRIDPRATAAFLLIVAAGIYFFELHPPHLPVPTISHRLYAPDVLVQQEWRDYARERGTHDILWLAIKLPTWAALLVAVVTALQGAFGGLRRSNGRRLFGVHGFI